MYLFFVSKKVNDEWFSKHKRVIYEAEYSKALRVLLNPQLSGP